MPKYRKPKTPPKPDVPFARATLIIAIQNIRSSRLLYDNGYYPEATFFMQQGIEKGCKSFGFYYGLIRKSDVFDPRVRHKGMGVYEITLRQLQNIISDVRRKINLVKKCEQKLNNKNPFFDDLENDVINAQRKLQFYTSNADIFFKIPDEDVIKIINSINEIDIALKTIDENLQNELISYEITDNMKGKAMDFIRSILPNTAISKNFFEKLDHQTLLTILRFTSKGLGAIGPLLQLAIITYPHEQRSRYADIGIPNEIYTMDFPLVNHFSELCDICESILIQLQKMYDFLPEPGGSHS